MSELIAEQIHGIVAHALAEDIGRGDITTLACVPESTRAQAQIVAHHAGVVAGLSVAAEAFRQIDPSIAIDLIAQDGAAIAPNDVLVRVHGSARGILTAERVALNFLGRMSGVASLTAHCVAATEGTSARIVDTRKTTPGLRVLEKYAVRMGGGRNHRFGLDDGILIKDNHIVASGGITQAVIRARAFAHHLLRIEVECETLAQVQEALEVGCTAILLDNMPVNFMIQAVEMIRAAHPTTIIEASGTIGTDPDRIREVAATGVDLISIGALTHSAPVFDLSLEFLAAEGNPEKKDYHDD
jgi:nicotinate-nucleotide pyrophosphorylase (carboxylating)